MSLKIGITERGDASIDFSWFEKILNHEVDAAILITKNITKDFIDKVLYLHNNNYKIVVHCTCTGHGGTLIEPNVPNFKEQLNQLQKLIELGFPKEQCVLRIDPIIPNEDGLSVASHVIDYAFILGLLPNIRVRVSILDEYKHVKERFKQHGIQQTYINSNQAAPSQLENVISMLETYPINYECCAEQMLLDIHKDSNKNKYLLEGVGCISLKELAIFGLTPQNMRTNPQNRNGCGCLSCKTELLSSKKQCPNGCLYCYWK